MPGWSQDLIVTFNPNTITTFLDTLHIINNDSDLDICLEGIGIGVPVFQTNHDTLIFNVNGCISTDSLPLLITNAGTLDLLWNSSDVISSALSDDFDPDIDNSQWSSISGGAAGSGCGVESAPNALYFNGSGVRDAITTNMNTLGGGEIEFYLKIGTGGSPCENADGGEDVALQYSTDGGAVWNTINIYDTESFNTFTYVLENIPLAAEATNCRFRWYQVSHSGSGFDNWAIDNVSIKTTSFSVFLSQNADTLNPSASTLVYVKVAASGLNAGSYETFMTFLTNDPFQPVYALTVILNINITPLVADAGADEIINSGSSVVLNASATGGLSPYTYIWTPTLGLSNPFIANPTASPSSSTTYSVTVIGSTGCVSVDEMEVAVKYSLDGTISYLNSNSEPISNSWALLKNSNQLVIDSNFTDAIGHYQFDYLDNSSYYLGLNGMLPWGGVNATDALGIQLHVVMLQPLTGLPLAAADVNASTTITSLDALFVLRRFVGYITSFPAGDWVSDTPMVTIENSNETADFKALCFGDVDGTYIINPTKSASPKVSLIETEEAIEIDQNKITIPVKMSKSMLIGAVSLGIVYPDDKLLFDGLTTTVGNMLYNDLDGIIKIAWADVDGMLLKEDEVLVNLHFTKTTAQHSPYHFKLLPESEFADNKGVVYQSTVLKIPGLLLPEQSGTAYISANYPNPFEQITKFDYYLPSDGKVILKVHDALGQTINTIINSSQDEGHYTIEFDGSGMSDGIYFYTFEFKSEESVFSITKKMYLIR